MSGDAQAYFAEQTRAGTIWASAKTFQAFVRRNIRLAEAPSFGQSIFEYAPRSHGAEDYQKLANEILGIQPRRAEHPAATALQRQAAA